MKKNRIESGFRVADHEIGSRVWCIQIKDTLRDAPETALDISEDKNRGVLTWASPCKDEDKVILIIAGDGNIYLPTRADNMFSGLQKLEILISFHLLNTSETTSMRAMFAGCKNMALIDCDLWDTRNLCDVSHMFDGCLKLTEIDISKWNTMNLQDMTMMFSKCASIKELDLRSWALPKLKRATNAFFGFHGYLFIRPIAWSWFRSGVDKTPQCL